MVRNGHVTAQARMKFSGSLGERFHKPVQSVKVAPRNPLFEYVRNAEVKRLLNQIFGEQQRLQFKTVAVISQYSREGRTFFVSALALAYAMLLGKRVLILDTANQTRSRCPYLNQIVGRNLRRLAGISERVKIGSIDLINARSIMGASMETADFQIGAYLEGVRDHYDLVILDTCAMGETGIENMDPVVIAKQVEASILITSDRSLNNELICKVRDDLGRWGVTILGTVYNRCG